MKDCPNCALMRRVLEKYRKQHDNELEGFDNLSPCECDLCNEAQKALFSSPSELLERVERYQVFEKRIREFAEASKGTHTAKRLNYLLKALKEKS